MTDPGTKFSQAIGWTAGERTGRYAMIVDKGKVVYAEVESSPGEVSVSDSSEAWWIRHGLITDSRYRARMLFSHTCDRELERRRNIDHPVMAELQGCFIAIE